MEYSGGKFNYYLVNGITIYRLVAAPAIALLVFYDQFELFRWLIAISFCTDAIDGFLARTLKVTSKLGARLDSIADDLTLVAAIYGAAVFKSEFFSTQFIAISLMVGLFVAQYVASLIRYKKLSSFHTYLAKLAMLLQGSFIILLFFLPEVPVWFFYIAVLVSVLDLVEEIILVFLLPKWTANVKGIYWVLTKRV
jgi:phosphatidylglycerophosphate synthase